MSLDAFLACPTPGCEMRVLKGDYLIRHKCHKHGGPPDQPQFEDCDPWGDLTPTNDVSGPAESLLPPVPAIYLGRVED